jgi:BirA family biotin operon repressor/biotin-[acetyl-CoA-carboxylase] ligase
VVDAALRAGVPAGLKWPNDVTCRGQKLAGILAQAGWDGARLAWVVVGIGLNANVPRQALDAVGQPATSLAVERGAPVDREATLAWLLDSLERRYEAACRDWAAVLADWRAHCSMLGAAVSVRGAHGEERRGIAVGIEEDGALRLRLPDGNVLRLVEGDVSVREC